MVVTSSASCSLGFKSFKESLESNPPISFLLGRFNSLPPNPATMPPLFLSFLMGLLIGLLIFLFGLGPPALGPPKLSSRAFSFLSMSAIFSACFFKKSTRGLLNNPLPNLSLVLLNFFSTSLVPISLPLAVVVDSAKVVEAVVEVTVLVVLRSGVAEIPAVGMTSFSSSSLSGGEAVTDCLCPYFSLDPRLDSASFKDSMTILGLPIIGLPVGEGPYPTVLLPTLCSGLKVGKKDSSLPSEGKSFGDGVVDTNPLKNLGVVVKKLAGTALNPKMDEILLEAMVSVANGFTVVGCSFSSLISLLSSSSSSTISWSSGMALLLPLLRSDSKSCCFKRCLTAFLCLAPNLGLKVPDLKVTVSSSSSTLLLLVSGASSGDLPIVLSDGGEEGEGVEEGEDGSSSEFSSLVVEGAFWVSIGCLPLVLTLNLLLILGEVRKFVVLTPKAEVFLEGRVLLSVEEAPEVVVALDDVRVVEVDSCEAVVDAGLTLKGCLMGCLCLATNLDEDLVEGTTASVELSSTLFTLEEASLAFVLKLTLPLCLILSLRVLMASLLVDGALVVLGIPAVEGLNL